MNLLDEQMREDQRALLSGWRVRFRQIGREIAPAGIQDREIIPLLLTLKHPTLFTHDQGFYKGGLRHPAYCLAWLNLPDIQAAAYIRRFLKHPAFDTHAKRMGVVARIHAGGIQCWRLGGNRPESLPWP